MIEIVIGIIILVLVLLSSILLTNSKDTEQQEPKEEMNLQRLVWNKAVVEGLPEKCCVVCKSISENSGNQISETTHYNGNSSHSVVFYESRIRDLEIRYTENYGGTDSFSIHHHNMLVFELGDYNNFIMPCDWTQVLEEEYNRIITEQNRKKEVSDSKENMLKTYLEEN